LARVIERAAGPDHVQHAAEVLAPAFENRVPHHRCLLRRAGAQRIDQRQRRLALGEVVAEALADRRRVARIIQHVVDQLERGADVPAVIGQLVLQGPGRAAEHAAEPRGGLEQLRRLAANHLEIARLVDLGVVAPHQLQHLASGDGVGGLGEHLHDAHVVDLDHHLEGAGIEKIADQHRGGVAEGGVGGAVPAPQLRFVDHVVVQQSGGVDELDHRGELQTSFAAITRRAAREQQQRGPQPLASRGDDVLGDLAHQRHVRFESPADQRVDALQILRDRRQHGHKTHDSLIIASLCGCNNSCTQ